MVSRNRKGEDMEGGSSEKVLRAFESQVNDPKRKALIC